MIHAKDLMIGDWVLINGTPRKIRAIDGVADEIIADDELYTLTMDRFHSKNKVEGVPLTTEILEKNGFNDDGESVYGDDDSYFIPTYQSGFDTGTYETHIEPNEGIGDFSGRLRYVHELQHALKLCVIDKEIII